ncbi:MAG: transcriptional repressor [Melioribacteraceae bacterium]|nr:transcriptional repressor [Melioribacteraceae bacterium]
MTVREIKEKLKNADLKITPQRLAILEAIYKLNNHPTADNIIDYIKETHPSVAVGTVYKVLDALVENHLIKKVKTENNVTHYDGIIYNHHHLYCSESDRIEDYMDEELDELLEKYFSNKGIKNFNIEEIKLQINGRFKKRGGIKK